MDLIESSILQYSWPSSTHKNTNQNMFSVDETYFSNNIIQQMGSQMCPGSAQQIIQELEQIEKRQGSYEALFKGCLNIRENKVNQILFQQEQHHPQTTQINPQQPEYLQEKKSIESVNPIELKENNCVQMYFQDGTEYKGQTKDGLPHGQGQEITSWGHYKGNFNMGLKEGYGVYIYSNKQRYQGEFIKNMLWGKGKYFFANGDCYEGQFVKNQRSGKGRYTFQKNNKESYQYFEGEYKNDLKEGKGRLKNTNYEMVGIWKCGLYEFNIDDEFIK